MKKKKKILLILIIIFTVLTIILLPMILFNNKSSHVDIDFNYVYENTYEAELPVEEPAKGGTLRLPKKWSFTMNDNWNTIKNENNEIIGYDVFKGYEVGNINTLYYKWKEYEENVVLDLYDYSNLEFEIIYRGSNTILEKSGDYFQIEFYNICEFKNSIYINRRYSKKYFIVGCNDIQILKIIAMYYISAGEI